MSDYQTKLGAINAEHAASVARLERETKILTMFADAGLPVPDYVGGALYGAVCVTYRNNWKHVTGGRNLTSAVELFKQFGEVVPHTIMRNSCTIIRPEKIMPKKETDAGYKRGPYASDYSVMLKVSHIENSQTRADLKFFAMVGGAVFEVSIEFGAGYIGNCGALTPTVKTERGFANKIVSRSFTPQSKITAYADKWLTFASGDTGPIKTASNHVFFFVAENCDENIQAVECEHAIDCLTTIAEVTGA